LRHARRRDLTAGPEPPRRGRRAGATNRLRREGIRRHRPGPDNITLRNTVINGPRRDGGDGIRFWGDNITISHNTITGTRNRGGAHADRMQTYATDADNPASQDVVIDSNRCEMIDNNCLIVEGPNSGAGDGSGEGETSTIISATTTARTGRRGRSCSTMSGTPC
jgi:hypothetical protein